MTANSDNVTLTTTVDSPIGPLTLTAVDGRLTGLHMAAGARPRAQPWLGRRAARFRRGGQPIGCIFRGGPD